MLLQLLNHSELCRALITILRLVVVFLLRRRKLLVRRLLHHTLLQLGRLTLQQRWLGEGQLRTRLELLRRLLHCVHGRHGLGFLLLLGIQLLLLFLKTELFWFRKFIRRYNHFLNRFLNLFLRIVPLLEVREVAKVCIAAGLEASEFVSIMLLRLVAIETHPRVVIVESEVSFENIRIEREILLALPQNILLLR